MEPPNQKKRAEVAPSTWLPKERVLLIDNTASGLPVKASARLSPGERLYCPVAFEPERTLRPAHFRYGDCLVYLCHAIIMARVRDPRYGKGHYNGFVPLTNRFMRNIVGHRRWQVVKSVAIECGLVECDGSYRAGQRSRGYRLCRLYSEAPWKARNICDAKLFRRLRKWRKERHRVEWEKIRSGETGLSAAVCEYLHNQLQRVRIDQCISEALTPEMGVAVDLIRRHQFFFHADRYGRLHTNVTNLKRSLRGYLSVNGKGLGNLDIASSQPLFLGLLLLGAKTHPRRSCREEGERVGGSPYVVRTHPNRRAWFVGARISQSISTFVSAASSTATSKVNRL